jgi:hypothetical protein
VQHHQQRDQGTRAVECNGAHRRSHGVISYLWFLQHRFLEASQIILVGIPIISHARRQ